MGNYHVLGLYIPVRDVHTMKVLYTVTNLFNDPLGLKEVKGFFVHPGEEIVASHILQDQIDPILVREEAVHLNDVGVAQGEVDLQLL